MKSSLKLAAMVMVVGVLCVGAVALGTDFVWDGPTSTDSSWLTASNWDLDSSYPQNDNDNATIDAAGNLCTFDPGSGNTLFANQVTVGGDSPTKRKLHFEDGSLIANEMFLLDYAELDVDSTVLVRENMELSGNVWIDVASGITFSALATSGQHDPHAINIESTTARLVLSGAGTFLAGGIEINADEASRCFKLDGGTLTINNYEDIAIISDPDVNGQRAKFWFANGTVNWSVGTYVEMVGGDVFAKRAELDLDQTLDLYPQVYQPGYTMIDGYASIDIADGKKFTMPRMTIGETGVETVVKVTVGSGAAIEVGL